MGSSVGSKTQWTGSIQFICTWTGLEDKPENYFIMSYVLMEKNGKTMLEIIQDDNRPHAVEEEAQEKTVLFYKHWSDWQNPIRVDSGQNFSDIYIIKECRFNFLLKKIFLKNTICQFSLFIG